MYFHFRWDTVGFLVAVVLAITASSVWLGRALERRTPVVELSDRYAKLKTVNLETIEIQENSTRVSAGISSVGGASKTEAVTFKVQGDDAELFLLHQRSGSLSFKKEPDYEDPRDQNLDNGYELKIVISGLAKPLERNLLVKVTNVNEPPELRQPDDSLFALVEPGPRDGGKIFVTMIEAEDPEGQVGGQGLVFSKLEGADARHFELDPVSGALSMRRPDYEMPTDENRDNIYVVRVAVADSLGSTTSKGLGVKILDRNEAPRLTNLDDPLIDVKEGNTSVINLSATDPEGHLEGSGLRYQLAGLDEASFEMDSDSGLLRFKSAPNFEQAGDTNQDNTYQLSVSVADALGALDSRSLLVRVIDDDEAEPPQILSPPNLSASMQENSRLASVDFGSSDPEGEREGKGLVYSLEGPDVRLFAVNSVTGDLSFLPAPDYELPQDRNLDNMYEVQVVVTDSTGASDNQGFSVTVLDINEPPVLLTGEPATFEVRENTAFVADLGSRDPEGQVEGELVYTKTGMDSSLFQIDRKTGVLIFAEAPDFESPGDRDADNVYRFEVSVSDSAGLRGSAVMSVTVTDVEVEPVAKSERRSRFRHRRRG